jgi:hypothetical protein
VAAARLGIDRVYPGERIWAGGQWLYVAGILRPAVLAPAIEVIIYIEILRSSPRAIPMPVKAQDYRGRCSLPVGGPGANTV